VSYLALTIDRVDLTEMLTGVQAKGYQASLERGQPAQQHLQRIRHELPKLAPPGMRVRVSGSGQSLPIVPWIALLDRDVTTTAQEGLYVVYLYRRDLSHVYLSMNQGATQHKQNGLKRGLKNSAAERAALSELRNESELLRQCLSGDTLEGLLSKIDLGASTYFLPCGYEAGNIAAVVYDIARLPPETVLRDDLARFLNLYGTCIESKREILATEPGRINTTADTKKDRPRFKPKPPAFRPKSSAEYRAHVNEQDQDKGRRHEELINLFARWARAASLTVANNVHPCDLTVASADVHWLVEAKTVGANAEKVVREAIGQLFAYRHFCYRELGRPDPDLVALFSEPVGDAFAELLASLQIEAIWRTGESWEGYVLDKRSSLLATTGQRGHSEEELA